MPKTTRSRAAAKKGKSARVTAGSLIAKKPKGKKVTITNPDDETRDDVLLSEESVAIDTNEKTDIVLKKAVTVDEEPKAEEKTSKIELKKGDTQLKPSGSMRRPSSSNRTERMAKVSRSRKPSGTTSGVL